MPIKRRKTFVSHLRGTTLFYEFLHTLIGYGQKPYIHCLLTAGLRLRLLSLRISGSRSKASTDLPIHCLASPDSSLQSGWAVLFLFLAFKYSTEKIIPPAGWIVKDFLAYNGIHAVHAWPGWR